MDGSLDQFLPLEGGHDVVVNAALSLARGVHVESCSLKKHNKQWLAVPLNITKLSSFVDCFCSFHGSLLKTNAWGKQMYFAYTARQNPVTANESI